MASNEDLLRNEGPSGASKEAAADSGAGGATAAGAAGTEKAPATLTKQQQILGHLRKFWLWYAIGFIIFLAILLPILFKVIIPAIVQAVVNNQSLPINGGLLRAAGPGLVEVSLKSTLDTPLPVWLDPFQLDLYNADNDPYSPFVTVPFGNYFVNHATEIQVINQTVEVKDEDELIKWLNRLFDGTADPPTTPLSVKGDINVHLGTLQMTPHIEKTLQLPGLSQLSGISLASIELMIPPVDGNNLKGSIVLPNRGLVALDLGDLTFSLFSGSIKLGQVGINNTVINPGNTTKEFLGSLYFDVLGQNLGKVLQSQAIPLGKGNIELNITGNTAMVNGERIPYLEKVLSSKKLPLEIGVVTFLSTFISGFLGNTGSGQQHNILDVFSDLLGNNTFIDNVMSHWGITPNNNPAASTNGTKIKRHPQLKQVQWDLLKLGLMSKLAARS